MVGMVPFKTEEEAIALANDTSYGLSASLWTKGLRNALVLAGQIKAGTVWLNEHLIVFCETPVGGLQGVRLGQGLIKNGFGRVYNDQAYLR